MLGCQMIGLGEMIRPLMDLKQNRLLQVMLYYMNPHKEHTFEIVNPPQSFSSLSLFSDY